jgi:hypothetical protein
MAKSQTSLKSKNALYLWTFVGINFAVFFAVTIGSHLDYSSVQHFWQRISAKNGFIGACMPLLVVVLNGILGDAAKARLVFWRWNNPLPGCRAFSALMHADPRIDVDRLKEKHAPLPRAAKEQNALWFKLYKKHSASIIVSDSHRLYLLTRDMASMSALFIVPFSVFAAFSSLEAKAVCLYAGALLLQYVGVATAARNYGNRFVKNVLTEESHSK